MCNVENKINDEEILKFLRFSYFGDLNISIKVASNRAYRDMCRTIKFNKLKDITDRRKLRDKVNIMFETEIKKLTSGSKKNLDDFNNWHGEVCENMKNLYEEKGIKLTYGQAQKWINMTIKYLYLFGGYAFDCVFEYLHIPIDNYIFVAVEKELKIDRPNNPWSKLDETEYLEYQKAIGEELKKRKYSPLCWEFKNWLEVAKGNNNN
ncbi:hypothetical protein [Parvimonas micra]